MPDPRLPDAAQGILARRRALDPSTGPGGVFYYESHGLGRTPPPLKDQNRVGPLAGCRVCWLTAPLDAQGGEGWGATAPGGTSSH